MFYYDVNNVIAYISERGVKYVKPILYSGARWGCYLIFCSHNYRDDESLIGFVNFHIRIMIDNSVEFNLV